MRSKIDVGGIYLFKDYHRYSVGGCVVPKKTYDSYVCRVKSVRGNRGKDRPTLIYVVVLACDVSEVGIGISDVHYNFSICSGDKPKPDSQYHRELITGRNKGDDCLSWCRFSIEDIPLCLGWDYISDELKGALLDGASS